jgi:hypothetical protein
VVIVWYTCFVPGLPGTESVREAKNGDVRIGADARTPYLAMTRVGEGVYGRSERQQRTIARGSVWTWLGKTH